MRVEFIDKIGDGRSSELTVREVTALKDKKHFEVSKIELSQGNRPGKIYLKAGHFEVGFIVWDNKYLSITAPNKTTKKKGEGEDATYNSYYNTVIEGSEKDKEIEDLASMVLSAYLIAAGRYGAVLKKRLHELRNYDKYNPHCSSCHHCKTASFSEKTPQGMTEDEKNDNIKVCMVNETLIEEYEKNDKRQSINYRKNKDYINHRYYGLDICPYHNKSYYNSKTETNIKETSAPYFPIEKLSGEEGDIFLINTLNYSLDLTYAFKFRKYKVQMKYYTKKLSRYVKGFDRERIAKIVHSKASHLPAEVVYPLIRELFNRYGEENTNTKEVK